MVLRIALAIIVFFLLSAFLAKYNKTPKNLRTQFLRNYGSLLAIGLLLLLIASGKLNVVLGAIGSVALLIWRNLFLLKKFAPLLFQLAARNPNFSPTIRTKYLKVQIIKGLLYGEIIEGLHKGKSIDELTKDDFGQLSEFYKREDKESLLLLHAYIQQKNTGSKFSENNHDQSYQEHSTTEISKKEALEILGLDESATREEINIAHKKLIQRLHPDRGGSTYLAAKVNQAKDILNR
ncbi:J domain-containing protein [Aurantivibrio infirmus]